MRAGVCGNLTRRMRRQRMCGAPRSETADAPGAQLTALRDSLRVRLPLLISAVIAVVLATFLAVAYRQVETTLLHTGEARAQAAAEHLAMLLTQSAQQRMTQLERVAHEAVVEEYLRSPTESGAAATRGRLLSLTAAGQPAVELWNTEGHRLMAVSPSAISEGAPTVATSSLPMSPPS